MIPYIYRVAKGCYPSNIGEEHSEPEDDLGNGSSCAFRGCRRSNMAVRQPKSAIKRGAELGGENEHEEYIGTGNYAGGCSCRGSPCWLAKGKDTGHGVILKGGVILPWRFL